MKVKVLYTDGTSAEAPVGPRAQIEVERKFDVLFSQIFDEDSGKARVEYFYFMGLAALKAAGHDSVADVDVTSDGAFEEWLDGVEDVMPIADSKGAKKSPRPTKKAQQRGSSSG